ncbi:hypothetical protein HY493_00310 [Candidatus Woesearchaeota archaeon]|nr:hypothetical protein [Candidatus Woesearchaeota archaeon]
MRAHFLGAGIILLLVVLTGCFSRTAQQLTAPAQPAARDEFGCFPPSCADVPDLYGKRACEEWQAGKEVSWPQDCAYAQTDACIKFCESDKKRLNKTSMPVPSGFPAFPGGSGSAFPDMSKMSPEDFMFHTTPPVCADDHYAQLIYARPSGTPDRFVENAATLRTWIAQANGIVNAEAAKFGAIVNLKVACDGDVISVLDVAMPRDESYYRGGSHGDGTRERLMADLQKLGYDDATTKYIVFYDGDAVGCGGDQGSCTAQSSMKGPDDRLSEDNTYNSGPDYAFMYSKQVARIPEIYHTQVSMLAPIMMLHEYSHTIGAVQLSAPHSANDGTDEGHCKDEPPLDKGGSDVMCKSDALDTVFDNECTGGSFIQYDCNNDDYFNPKPAPGSYLATHWNLGSELNRFFAFGDPNI